jgi:hypothetical protein
MAGQAPKSRYVSFPARGVLNEINTPAAVGGSGLTAAVNLIYHRQGAWGKRTGSNSTVLPPGEAQTPVSGFRWYKAYPPSKAITKLVTYAQGVLSIGNDPHHLNSIGTFALSGTTAPCFTSARDPQANSGQGADVLIVTGLILPAGVNSGSPSTGQITITGLPGTQPNGVYATITVSDGTHTITCPRYYILGTDNPASIASQLCILINQTNAYLNNGAQSYPPWLGEFFYTATNQPFGATQGSGGANPGSPQPGAAPPSATIYLGANEGGTSTNAFTYSITLNTGSGGAGTLAVTPSGATNMTGGGAAWSGPARYETPSSGVGNLVPLSYMAPNAFSQCVTWHNHVWFWGDPGTPDTVFASDIFQPEAFTFMIQNGPSAGPNVGTMNGANNGGYQIGPGDGDREVQACIPIGNAMYVLKTANIYMIEGYDFQQGEYQFSVTPQVSGYGIPNPYCAAVLENELIFWSGRKFLRLAVGAYEPEHIGFPIPFSEGTVSGAGSQLLVRCVAGDFQVKAALTNNFGLPQPYPDATIIYRSLALWAFDATESGAANTVMVYDDEATQERQQYAWAPWSGWSVGCWIQQGTGPTPSGNDVDAPIAYFIDSAGFAIHQVGAIAASDSGTAIPWMAQTGWVDFSSPEVLKNAHRMFLTVEAQAGATLSAILAPGRIIPNSGQVLPYNTTPITLTFAPTLAPSSSGAESLNDMERYIEPSIQAESIVVQITEPGSSLTGFELQSWSIDVNPEEAMQP